jgi:PAS domain S-box-containing protein
MATANRNVVPFKESPAEGDQLFRHLFEEASLGIAIEDMEGKLLLANPALCRMLGYGREELCSMSCDQFASAEDSQDDWAHFQQLRAGAIDHYSLEKRYIRKDGARIWGRLNVSLLKSGDGGSPLVVALVEDIRNAPALQETCTMTSINVLVYWPSSFNGSRWKCLTQA